MELTHSFTVPVPLDRAWDVLLDVERVAPCMPGATLDSVEGDDITGKIKVKVGPISMVYAGKASFTLRDKEAGLVTLDASGKETRGAGTAAASVRSELVGDGDQTHVTVHTNLNITGKPAQFGRGVMNEVGGKLIGIFADNLAKLIAAEPDSAGTAQAGAESAAADPVADAAASSASETTAAESSASAEKASAAAELALPIEDLDLPLRAYNGLRRDGVHTIGDLVAKTAQELLAIDNIGPASVDEIRQRLADHGLALSEASASANGAGHPATAFPGQPATSAGDAAPADDTTTADKPAPARGSAATQDSAAQTSAAQDSAQTPAVAPTPLRSVPAPRPERSWESDDDAIDLLSVAGLPVLKRALPIAAGVLTAAIVAALGLRRRKRRAGR